MAFMPNTDTDILITLGNADVPNRSPNLSTFDDVKSDVAINQRRHATNEVVSLRAEHQVCEIARYPHLRS